MSITPMPAGAGIVKRSDRAEYGIEQESYYVQTPDALWAVMFARMQSQVSAREKAMSDWTLTQRTIPGYLMTDYWRDYYTERAKYRVDYPMPWGHVIFKKEGKGK